MDTKRTSMTRFFNPYLALASLALFTTLQQLQAQITSISIEPVLRTMAKRKASEGARWIHDIPYRADERIDFVSAVYGDAEKAL